MDLKILRNNGITTLKVNLLDVEIVKIVNFEMTEFGRSAFTELWNGDLMEKYRALSMIIMKAELNEQASYIMESE